MKTTKKSYVEVAYNETDKPFTTYPKKLATYLSSRFNIKKDCKILELGCGRGELLNSFIDLGIDGYGTDISDYSKKKYPKIKFTESNILKEKKIPFSDNFFDFVYSKSFIEHFYDPDFIFTEIFRVLKPNGKVLTLTPDWQFMSEVFYDDSTHKRPFTTKSLKEIQIITGYSDVVVEKFRQLPVTWNKYSSLNFFYIFFAELTRIFFPASLKKIKWVRFSKEIMLLSSAQKILKM